MDQVVIIPTLNPNGELVSLVDGLQRVGFRHFIVVDDGSDSKCEHVFCRLQERGLSVYHHARNLGKGAAIKTAVQMAETLYPESRAYITVDGDGQHLPNDVRAVAQEQALHPSSVVLGERGLHSRSVPLRSRLGNGFSATYFKLDTGITCHDTQTGLRCFPASLVPFMLDVEGERYEYEMNFLTRAAKEGIDLRYVPITTVYLNGNKESHFDTITDSYRIYRSFIRFTASSMTCAAVDLGLFALLTSFLDLEIAALVIVATLIARVSSGVLNFALNRRWSFRAEGSKTLQAGRYAAVFVTQMMLSMLFVYLLAFLPLPLVAVKIVVDSTLFVFSYFFQRNWVFKKEAAPEAEDIERISDGAQSRTHLDGASEATVSVGMRLRSGLGFVRRVRAVGYLRNTEGGNDSRSSDYRLGSVHRNEHRI